MTFIYAIPEKNIKKHNFPLINDKYSFYNVFLKFKEDMNDTTFVEFNTIKHTISNRHFNNGKIQLSIDLINMINKLTESHKIFILNMNTNNPKENDGLHLYATDNSPLDIKILQWGNVCLSKCSEKYVVPGIFKNFNGKILANEGSPRIFAETSFKNLFLNSKISKDDFGNIQEWNTENVINMKSAFEGCSEFNTNLNNWNTKNVTTMECMFKDASKFNENIIKWDTSNIVNMTEMFKNAVEFNQSINTIKTDTHIAWNTGKVKTMEGMFENSSKFNGLIKNWNINNVKNMKNMFKGASNYEHRGAFANIKKAKLSLYESWKINEDTAIENILKNTSSKNTKFKDKSGNTTIDLLNTFPVKLNPNNQKFINSLFSLGSKFLVKNA
jgi:surface protein